jgi:hypothetical protein
MLRLTNGRAVLAALYRQYFKLRGRWHIVQGLGAEYGPLVGHGIRRIDRKLAAWRATREFLADLSDADASEDLESAPSLDLQTVLTTILP